MSTFTPSFIVSLKTTVPTGLFEPVSDTSRGTDLRCPKQLTEDKISSAKVVLAVIPTNLTNQQMLEAKDPALTAKSHIVEQHDVN